MNAEAFLNEVQRAIIEDPTPRRSRTFLETIGREFDEDFISDYLAALLQDANIQNTVLPLLLKERDWFPSAQPRDIRIHREYTLDEHNRIDLLIEVGDDCILAIENKVLSPEGHKQTDGYLRLLKRHFGSRQIVSYVLSPDYRKVHSKSFEPITYRELFALLARSSFITELDSDSLLRLRDFLIHMERHLMRNGKPLSLSALSKLYVRNLDTLEKLEEAFEKDCDAHFAFIKSLVAEHFPEPEWRHSYYSGYFQVYKEHWNRKGLFVHLEFWTDPRKLLTCDYFEVMIDAEKPGREGFYAKLESKNRDLISKLRKKGYLYRPPERKTAVAYKIIKYPKKIELMETPDWRRVFAGVFLDLDRYVDPIEKSLSR